MDITNARCRPLDEIEAGQSLFDENYTQTAEDQIEVEDRILRLYKNPFHKCSERKSGQHEGPVLQRESHVLFLKKGLFGLSDVYEVLDASRPWLCYWILHSLGLLKVKLSSEESHALSDFLGRCQSKSEGGFGGGPGQFSHLAATYAAINALVSLNSIEALKIIDREKLRSFIKSMRQPDGSFCMHRGGETDVRAAYCALVAAKITNIYTPELFEGTAEWVLSCQTYEGGFAGYPGMEAHGGYTFCAVAALILLKADKLMRTKAFMRWLVFRQMAVEGGFQGRTNKLVDGCYSYWQGACFSLITRRLYLTLEEDLTDVLEEETIYHPVALQEYILECCQHPAGGLVDKPGKTRDFYHTCYTLSGLAASQHYSRESKLVIGPSENLLEPIHPVYNLTTESVRTAEAFFYSATNSTLVEEVIDS